MILFTWAFCTFFIRKGSLEENKGHKRPYKEIAIFFGKEKRFELKKN